MVPRDLQDEVYRTVKLRDRTVNETWAPWWRAQALATVAAGKKAYPGTDVQAEKWLAKEMAFADTLESRA